MLIHGFYILILCFCMLSAGAVLALRVRARRRARRAEPLRLRLLDHLIALGDVLQEVSEGALTARGGWDRGLFDSVLGRVESLTPAFQGALSAYLRSGHDDHAARLDALLDVDRLSAAYTYWTRLFPPRQANDTMFVLSLLHDLSARVEDAIRLLDGAGQ